jgi:hypothetical protein
VTFRRLPALAGLILLAGCGEPVSSASDPTVPSTATSSATVSGGVLTVVDGEVQVGCGGAPGWSPSVMAAGIDGVVGRAEVVAAFTELLQNPEIAGELEMSFLQDGPEQTEWRVLAAEGDSLTLGLGTWTEDGPGEGARTFGLERDGDGWRWTGGGDCRLEPVLGGDHSWVELTAPPGGLDPTSTTLPVEVSERECTSGRDPRPHLEEPHVVETTTTVTVYWTSVPPEGFHNCMGNPAVAATVPLRRPLGERTLLDGSTYPPSPVGARAR